MFAVMFDTIGMTGLGKGRQLGHTKKQNHIHLQEIT